MEKINKFKHKHDEYGDCVDRDAITSYRVPKKQWDHIMNTRKFNFVIAAIGVIIGISGVISGIVIGIVLGNTGTNADNELYKNELRDDGYCDYKSYESFKTVS